MDLDKVDVSNSSIIANAGTNLNTSVLALETGGNLASIKTSTSQLLELYTLYTTAIENNTTGSPIYIGHAMPGTLKSATGWRIAKYTYDINGYFTDRQWADGNTNLDNVWDNRATYSYG